MRVKKSLSLIFVLVLLLALLPGTALAGGAYGAVSVTVENTTFTSAAQSCDGMTPPSWNGTLLSVQVPINDPDMTMMDAIGAALTAYGYTSEGLYGGYISSINGLAEKQGAGQHSGWMGTINGWFVSMGFNNFSVRDGDAIRVMYTNADSGGADLGGTWLNNDKSVSALGISAGMLTPPFSAGTTSYTLTLPAGTGSVTVTPWAANMNFQVRVKSGAESFDGVRWGPRTLPVTDGDTITVSCGSIDPLWPSMNNGPPPNGAYAENVPGVTYTIAVIIEGGTAPVQAPVFSADLSADPVTYAVGQAATPLTVAAGVSDGGTVTYQWYSNTVSSMAGGTPVGTGDTVIPSTAAAGTTYYYAIATNTQGGGTATAASQIAAVTTVLRGDIDGGGSVNGMDLTLMKRYFSGLTTLSGAQRTAADVDGNGAVNGLDLTLMKRYFSGLISTFG